MALVVADRVQETTSTTSTSSYVLLGAANGYQSFGAVLANGDTTYYAITNDTDWEVGIGTYSTTGPTLARTTILASSNGGSAVSWGVGVKNIFISYAASKASFLDANGDLLVADKIVHTGDTSTAIRFPAANTVSVETSGVERFKVENSTITTTVPIALPANPTLALQATTKQYVDALIASGIHFHTPVRVESPTALTATYNNGTSGVGATLTNAGTQAALVIDGVTVATNDRVLIYTQVNQTQNGIYVVTNTGSGSTNWVLTRAADANTYVINNANGLSEGSTVFVQQGATGAGETYTCNTSGTITFGTTNITFAQISTAQIYSAGSGLALTGTVFSNTAPDQVVTLTQGGATTITGTYPNFTISSVNTTYTAGGGIGLTGTAFSVAAGSGLTQDTDGLSHADTSSQTSVDNTGAVFIQDVSLDGFGHVTSLASTTITPALIGAATADSPVFTGVASFPDGSAAAPSITNTGDTNTGMFFPAADTIAFSEGGVESMRIDASGNLGLGVTPSAWYSLLKAMQIGTFSISDQSNTGYSFVARNAYPNASNVQTYIENGFATRYQQGAGTHQWQTAPSGTAGNAITFTQAMTLDASGNLGLGTTSPEANGRMTLDRAGSNYLMLRSGGTNRMSLYVDSGVSVVDAQANPLLFNAGGSERMRITSAGNVGIGTASPTTKLDVNGVASAVFFENPQTITASYTIASGKNAMSVGPVTVDAGATITVSAGARYVVI